tara:strand:+ start:1547 stop:1984 length:438 start_codon:yes stop_codon:yes gene_type:complete
MTEEQREFGRAMSVSILLLITIIAMFLSSCSPYYYQSKGPEITHVLALTKEGDTLKIPIKDIKPNVVYNVIGYDWYHIPSGYYNRWNNPYYHPHLYNIPKPSYNGNSNYNNNNNNNTPVNTTPTIKPQGNVNPPNPVIVNPRKNN